MKSCWVSVHQASHAPAFPTQISQDAEARVTLLKAVAAATTGWVGLSLLHLAVVMLRNGLLQEALPIVYKGLLPRAEPARFLSIISTVISGAFYEACLREIASALIPEHVSGHC